jgi:predicted nucleic acid-binding protein
MILYLDASALVKRHVAEAGTEAVAQAVASSKPVLPHSTTRILLT